MVCKNINITPEESSTILVTLSTYIYQDYAPRTIVDYVCAAVDIPLDMAEPQVSATNWCILTCVSGCVFRTSLFTAPSTYAYINKPLTYMCVTSCFPVASAVPPLSGSGGGGAAPAESPLALWKDAQIVAVEEEEASAIDWLEEMLDHAFVNLALTCASFALWIAMLVEHLIEITFGTLMELIGEAIRIISCIWRNVKDLLMGLLHLVMAGVNIMDDMGNTHIKTEQPSDLQSAWSEITTAFTGIFKCVGEKIEQSGQFIIDWGDIAWDVKQIAFAILSLAAMIKQIYEMIKATFERIVETIEAAYETIKNLIETYDEQILEKLGITAVIDEFNRLVDEVETILNMGPPEPSAEAGYALIDEAVDISATASVGGISVGGTLI